VPAALPHCSMPLLSRTKTCKNCGVAPANKGFDYCSRTCGRAAMGGGRDRGYGTYPMPNSPGGNLCAHCGMYPPNPPHQFCSRTCGQAATRGDPPPQFPTYGPPQPPPQPGPWSWFMPPRGGGGFSGPPSSPCCIPGCTGTGYKGGKYCSHPCREKAVKQGLEPACLFCKKYPRVDDKSHFCGKACQAKATAAAPILLEVPITDPRFTDVAGQFKTAWKGTAPNVVRVYKIILPQKLLDEYEAYKKTVEARGNFSKRGMQPGNERRRWHGTARACTLGDDPNDLTPCTKTGCRVCAVVRSSYDVKFASGGLFGTGIYSSATSSKSNSYTSSPASKYKAMFLNRVVVGKGHILTATQSSLKAPPAGHDSVIANLTNDELIVYRNDAIRTSWLLIYG